MRALALAIAGGLAVLLLKVWLAFHVWAIPELVEMANLAIALVLALALVIFRPKRSSMLVPVTAFFVLACGSIPVELTVAKARVSDAKAYCEALAACTDKRCPPPPSPSSKVVPALPGRSIPVLLRPGYSFRYPPQFRSGPQGDECQFPAPFPGRVFWEGTRAKGGRWDWEKLMD